MIGFSLFAFLAIPIQMLMIKNSRGQRGLMFIVYVMLKFFASGSYAIIYIYANELFPTSIRNTGIGICSMIARLGAIAGTLFNDRLVNSLVVIWIENNRFVFFSDSNLVTIAYFSIWCYFYTCSCICIDLSGDI